MNDALELTNLHQLCSYLHDLLLMLAYIGQCSVRQIEVCQQVVQANAFHQSALRYSYQASINHNVETRTCTQTAQHLLQDNKSIAIWQENQVFKLDHTWDQVFVGVHHPFDLVLYQMWKVNMVCKTQPLDRKILSRCSVFPPAEDRSICMQLANRSLDEPHMLAPLVHHLSTPVDAPP